MHAKLVLSASVHSVLDWNTALKQSNFVYGLNKWTENESRLIRFTIKTFRWVNNDILDIVEVQIKLGNMFNSWFMIFSSIGVCTQKLREGCLKFLGGVQNFLGEGGGGVGGCRKYFLLYFWTFRGPSLENFLKFPQRKSFQRNFYAWNFF